MPLKLINKFEHLTLKDLAEKLHMDYYKVIMSLVKNAADRLSELKREDVHQVISKYTTICEQILAQVRIYLAERKDVLLPYLAELHEKQDTGHNCSTCSGGCDMGHLSQFASLRESHSHLYSLLHQLQGAALPLYTNVAFPALYSKLRNEMLLLDVVVRELLFVEEAHLMGGILQAQKKINVHS